MSTVQRTLTTIKNKLDEEPKISQNVNNLDTWKSFGPLVKKLLLLTGLILLNLGILFSYSQIHASKQTNLDSAASIDMNVAYKDKSIQAAISSEIEIYTEHGNDQIKEGDTLHYALKATNLSASKTESVTLKQEMNAFTSFLDAWIMVNIDQNISLYSSQELREGIVVELAPGSRLRTEFVMNVNTVPSSDISFESVTHLGNETYTNQFAQEKEPVKVAIDAQEVNGNIVYDLLLTNDSPLSEDDVTLQIFLDKDTNTLVDTSTIDVLVNDRSVPFSQIESGMNISIDPFSNVRILIEFQVPRVNQVHFNTRINEKSYANTLTIESNNDLNQKTK